MVEHRWIFERIIRHNEECDRARHATFRRRLGRAVAVVVLLGALPALWIVPLSRERASELVAVAPFKNARFQEPLARDDGLLGRQTPERPRRSHDAPAFRAKSGRDVNATPSSAEADDDIVRIAKRRQRVAFPISDGPSVARVIKQEYGVDLALKDQRYPVTQFHGLIRATDANTAEVDHYCTILAQEFLLYPPDLIRRSRLKRIVLCRGLSFEGQNRAALPDFEHDTLYLDVVAGDYDRNYQRGVIHHDFFHIIDYRDDGQVYSDEQWAKLNPPTFQYGNGGAQMRDDHWSGMPWDRPGFLNKYSTSGVEEDKAELFAHMITEYAVVGKRAETDISIRNKVSIMKALLEKFCPEIDETFWDELNLRQSLTRQAQ